MVIIFLIGLFLSSFLVHEFFWLFVFTKLAKYQPEVNSIPNNKESISVIIAGKNEEANIKRFLAKVLAQDYPSFEVIFIDDHSEDESITLLQSMKDSKLKVYKNLAENKGKKSAIEYGIQQANFELLAFIDADCFPKSKYWLQAIANSFVNKNHEIVLGHGSFLKKEGFFNKLIRYENLLVSIQYLSLAIGGKPYMGVGRNMAYRKSVFTRSNKFRIAENIKSGDDDLFINENAHAENTVVLVNQSSHTVSKPIEDFGSFFIQKRRHFEAGSFYKKKDILRLALINGSQYCFYLSLILLLIFGEHLTLIFSILILKYLIQIPILKKINKHLDEKDILLFLPILESIYIFLFSLIGFTTLIWKVDRWK